MGLVMVIFLSDRKFEEIAEGVFTAGSEKPSHGVVEPGSVQNRAPFGYIERPNLNGHVFLRRPCL